MPYAPFQHWLHVDWRSPTTGRPLERSTASDYASRMRRLESLLGHALDQAAPDALRDLAASTELSQRCVAAGVSPKVMTDLTVALRAFAQFRAAGSTAVPPPTQSEVLALARIG